MNGWKGVSIRLGVHLTRHLQVLVAWFPECFSPDHISKLKHDHFYRGLPKRLKAMVAYLEASAKEKTCSDYLCAMWEAEKEESMEASHSQTEAMTSKSKTMSFFPLRKLKGNQPTKTPAVQVAHLEEEDADEEECADSEDPDGIQGIMDEFIICLARVLKDAQWEEKCCYHCSSPKHFMWSCLLVVACRTESHLNQKEGMVPKKGAWAPQGKVATSKVPQDRVPKVWDTKQCYPLLNPNPFNQWYGIENVAKVRVNGESCMALLDNGIQINTIMWGFIENHSLDVGPLSDFVGRWVACIGLGNAFTWLMGYVVIWVQVDRVQGYDEDQIALVIPDLSTFMAWVPGNPHDKLHHECDKGEGDRWPGNAMGKCPGGLSLGSLTCYSHCGRWQICCWSVRPCWIWWSSHHQGNQDDWCLLILHYICKDRECFHWCKAKCDDSGPMCWRWVTEPRHDNTECLHWDVQWQQECCHHSEKYYSVPPDSEEDPSSKCSCGQLGARVAKVAKNDRGIGQSPRHPNGKPDDKAKTGETIQKVGSEWIGILATRAGRIHPVSSGQVSWQFLLRTQWTCCTHSTKHVIKVTTNIPFKERFRQIPPPLVEEVHIHLWEMLDLGTICPSQGVWCNAVVLVWKKDGGPMLLHRFLPSQYPHKERFLPTPKNPGGAWELGCCWPFLMLRPEVWILVK